MSYGTKPVNNSGFMSMPDFNNSNFQSFDLGLGSQDYSMGSDFMNTASGITPYQGFDTGVNVDLLNAPGVGSESISNSGGMFDNFFMNEKGGQGWGLPAIGAATGVAQTFLGFNQLSEGRKQNRIANNQWQAQFDIQKQEYDRRVSERDARVASSNAKKQKASLGG
jgi:hypothetical protein